MKALRSLGIMVSLLAMTGIRFVLLPISFIATMSKVFKLSEREGGRVNKERKEKLKREGDGCFTCVPRGQ